jgi:hypothetical protein
MTIRLKTLEFGMTTRLKVSKFVEFGMIVRPKAFKFCFATIPKWLKTFSIILIVF